jgi:putative NIF3 family GTP cyclohydrolase 1 type 2
MSTADIKKSYTVMGKIMGQSVLFEDFDKIQAKIVDEAQKRGADAVLIYDMEEKTVGTVQNTNQTTTAEEHKQWWSLSGSSTTVTNNQVTKILHADFLKYK